MTWFDWALLGVGIALAAGTVLGPGWWYSRQLRRESDAAAKRRAAELDAFLAESERP